jgi:hypothetical protein
MSQVPPQQQQQNLTIDQAIQLAEAHRQAGRLQEAAQIFEQVLRANPNHLQAMYLLGECALKGGNIPAAIELFTRAGNLQPLWPAPRVRLGFAYLEQQQIGEAEAAFRAGMNLDPNFADAHYGLAWTRLIQGDFSTGWEEMEWRLKCPNFAPKKKNFPQPEWKGEDLTGKTILLFQEQGHGDLIQYARYIPLVADRGGRVLLGCAPPLAKILQTIRGVAEIAPDPTRLPPFDYQLTIYGLPRVFRTTLETIPQEVPYVHADEALVRKWSSRVDRKSKQFHVGLCWAGNPKHENDALRSLAPEMLAFFAGAPGVKFYSLQKDVDLNHSRRLPAQPALIDWAVDLHDFADTAAAMMNLDLIISVDTSIAHLAGALARPVWTLLPFHADWRWLLNRADSPWYPTMRLFRQQMRADWTGVLIAITAALREKVSQL